MIRNRSITVLTNASYLVTMDPQRREITDGALVLEGPQILWVGANRDLPAQYAAKATLRFNAQGKIVLPGFVNTQRICGPSSTSAPSVILRRCGSIVTR